MGAVQHSLHPARQLSCGSRQPLGGRFNRNTLHHSDRSVVKGRNMLTHSIFPKNEERC
jgi:hypothetical protein